MRAGLGSWENYSLLDGNLSWWPVLGLPRAVGFIQVYKEKLYKQTCVNKYLSQEMFWTIFQFQAQFFSYCLIISIIIKLLQVTFLW